MQWLNDWLNSFLQFFKDFALYVPKWVLQHILEALTTIINAIPVPVAFADFANASGQFTGPVVWWLTLLQVPYGIGVIFGAMLARFLLRRIPFIG
jgi:hypothetical protein